MRSTRFTLLILFFALATTACQKLNPVQSITTLRENSSKIVTARMLMTVNMKFDFGSSGATTSPYPSEVNINSEGVIDFENSRGQMLMKLSDYAEKFGAPAGTVDDISILNQDSFVYYQVPDRLASQFQGKRWVKLDNSAFQRQVGLNPTSASGNQPQTFFEYFDNVSEGDIEEIGSEELRGVGTTHYRVNLTLDDLYAGASPDMRKQLIDQAQQSGLEIRPSEIWIDKDGFARKMTIAMGTKGDRGSFETVMTMELYDFGAKIDVAIPPDSEVFVASDASALGPLFGSSSASGSSSVSPGQPPVTGGGYGY